MTLPLRNDDRSPASGSLALGTYVAAPATSGRPCSKRSSWSSGSATAGTAPAAGKLASTAAGKSGLFGVCASLSLYHTRPVADSVGLNW